MIQSGTWSVVCEDGGQFTVTHANGVAITCAGPALGLLDGTVSPDGGWQFDEQTRTGRASWFGPRGLKLTLKFEPAPAEDWLAVRLSVTNASVRPMPILRACPLSAAKTVSPVPFERALLNGQSMVDYSAVVPLDCPRVSHSVTAFTDADGTCALALGFGELGSSFCNFEYDGTEGGVHNLAAAVERDGVPIGPGDTLELPPLLIGTGQSMSALLDQYASMVGEAMGARANGPIMTGWCSWYDYYGTETEADVLDNVAALANAPLRDKVRVIQIDDGWNLPGPGQPRVWGDWEAGGKFPNGMKHTADKIREAGFIPGLWLAPFSVDPASNLFREHPDWMLRDENGPKPFWGVYALDLTQQPVLDYIRSVFDRVFHQWGFGYIKIDFLVHAVMEGWRQDCLQTVAQAFRRGLQVIREVAGEDNFILGCGCPMGPAIGIVDGMRIGTDVSSRWFVPMNLGAWPEGNCCIRPSAVYSVWRQWMHRRWWQNDPDCLQVREDGSQPEKDMFAREFGGQFATQPPFGLSGEEALFWTRLVWFTGGMSLVSENMTSLAPERAAILERAFPPNPQVPRVVDWYANLRVPVLRTQGGRLRIGIFNMSDDEVSVRISAPRLGLPAAWNLRELWTGEEFRGGGAEAVFPPLPAHAARIWELQ